MTAIEKISKRAKQIIRQHPRMAWKQAIKTASREYRAGKLGAVRKKLDNTRQTGKSRFRRDIQRQAKAPGKRKSASGKTYYERRKNRSDKPGTLAGVKPGKLKAALVKELKEQLGKKMIQREFAPSAKAYRKASAAVTDLKSQIRKLT